MSPKVTDERCTAWHRRGSVTPSSVAALRADPPSPTRGKATTTRTHEWTCWTNRPKNPRTMPMFASAGACGR
ncbi:hypothetical protein C1D09_019815 [Mesorhizobium intechi]|nr:hypothetical protein C1D09_019815 [Mesorhizobium intechi]